MYEILSRVKEIRLERADVFSEGGQLVEGARRLIETKVFDQDGREVERTLYNSSQDTLPIKGNMHPPGGSVYRAAKTYNDRGDLSETTLFDHDDSISSKAIYSYDFNGNPLTRVQYNAANDFTEKGVYTYDSSGRLTELLLYNADDVLTGKVIFDPAWGIDKPLKRTSFNLDGSVQRTSVSVYDSNGNLIEKSYYREGGSLDHKITYRYDMNGNLVEHLWYGEDGSLFRQHLRTFDEKNNLIKETVRHVKKNVVESYAFAYEFDSKGNWIKKTVFEIQREDQSSTQSPDHVIYRTLTYW